MLPARATIQWHRQIPEMPYTTVVKLAHPRADWSSDAWSMVVISIANRRGQTSDAEVGFLSEKAPAELLVPGCSFELYEGRRKVATGRIVQERL